mgnify:CR=1 FL=1
MYADTFYLATHDGNLKNFTIPIWLIGQGAAAFLIIVYLYLQKKRKELASLRNTFINAMAHEMKNTGSGDQNSRRNVWKKDPAGETEQLYQNDPDRGGSYERSADVHADLYPAQRF